MHTLKMIFRTCECGKMNTVYQARTIHNRIDWCDTCHSLSIKEGMAFRKYSQNNFFAWDWQIESFEKFAIAWG